MRNKNQVVVLALLLFFAPNASKAEAVSVSGVGYFGVAGGQPTLEECNDFRKSEKARAIAEAERAYSLDYVDKKTSCLAKRWEWSCRGEPTSNWQPEEPTSCKKSIDKDKCGEAGAPCFLISPYYSIFVYEKMSICDCEHGSDPTPGEE